MANVINNGFYGQLVVDSLIFNDPEKEKTFATIYLL